MQKMEDTDTSNKNQPPGTVVQVKNWWDSKQSGSFFPDVYRDGDNSYEGNLLGLEMDVKARTQRECDLIILNIDPKNSDRILDCPCGYGRHTLELARRGFKVTGLDLCSSFIAEARQNALKESLTCDFIEGDMREMPFEPSYFDYAVNMFLSFGFFDDDENQRTLLEFCRVLKIGGRLFLHSDVNPHLINTEQYGDRAVRHLVNGGILHIDEHYNPSTRRLEGCWKIDKSHDNVKAACYSVRIYSEKELREMALAAGFRDFKLGRVFADNNALLPQDQQEVIYIMEK